MSTGEHILSALQFMAIAVIIVTLGRELPKAARRAWRMTRDLSFRWRRRRFIGRRQFTRAARRAELQDWRDFNQAILNEPVDGWINQDGKRPAFGDIVKSAEEKYASGLAALDNIKQRGYISRRLSQAAKQEQKS